MQHLARHVGGTGGEEHHGRGDVLRPARVTARDAPPPRVRHRLGLQHRARGNAVDGDPARAQLGTPLIGPFQGRWIYVAQGAICFDNATNTLSTTSESGVGLAFRDPDSPFPDSTDRGAFRLGSSLRT